VGKKPAPGALVRPNGSFPAWEKAAKAKPAKINQMKAERFMSTFVANTSAGAVMVSGKMVEFFNRQFWAIPGARGALKPGTGVLKSHPQDSRCPNRVIISCSPFESLGQTETYAYSSCGKTFTARLSNHERHYNAFLPAGMTSEALRLLHGTSNPER
jgi:hypothetical protein